MGLLSIELSPENQSMVKFFNEVYNSNDNTIDWQSFFLLSYLDELSNIQDKRELVLTIREAQNDYREVRLNESKVIDKNPKPQEPREQEKIGRVNYG